MGAVEENVRERVPNENGAAENRCSIKPFDVDFIQLKSSDKMLSFVTEEWLYYQEFSMHQS